MKTRLAHSQLCPLLLAAAWFLAASSAFAGIVFDKPSVNLGRMRGGTNLRQAFPFKVDGDSPVTIADIRPSCGCLRPIVAQRTYESGSTGEVVMEVHTLSQKPGPQRFLFTLAVQEPQPRTLTLTLEVELYCDVRVSPATLLIYVNGTDSVRHTIAITDARAAPLHIAGAAASTPKIALRAANPSAGTQTIDLLVAGDFPPGKHEETLDIQTDDADYPKLSIPVTVVRQPRLRVYPNELRLARAGGAANARRQLFLRDQSGAEIQIANVSCADPRVQLQWNSTPGPRPVILASIDPAKISEPFEATIVIELARPEKTEVPVSIRVE